MQNVTTTSMCTKWDPGTFRLLNPVRELSLSTLHLRFWHCKPRRKLRNLVEPFSCWRVVLYPTARIACTGEVQGEVPLARRVAVGELYALETTTRSHERACRNG